MVVTPRIFISATSGDLRSHRAVVAAALKKLESYAEVQDDWPHDYRTVEQMLRRRLKDSDAVIHLAGLRYGAEPGEIPAGKPRRSYTQMEYYLAREMGKPVYLFLLPEGYPFDDHAPAEDEEKTALQAAHRARILADPHLRSSPRDTAALESSVLALQPLVDTLRARLRRQRFIHAAVVAAFFVVTAGVAWAVFREKDINRQQARDIAELQKPESAEIKFFKEIQLRRSQSPLTGVSASGGSGRSQGLSYADALTEVAKDHGLTADALRGMLDSFATRVLADPAADPYERAVAEFHRKNFAAATTLATSAAEAAEAAMKEQRERAITLWALVGDSEQEQFHYRAALSAWQKALALADKAADPKLWVALATRAAQFHQMLGEWKPTEQLYREILRTVEDSSWKTDRETAVALNNLAQLLQATSRFAEAEPLLRRTLVLQQPLPGEEDSFYATLLNNLSQVLQATGQSQEAEMHLRRALVIDESLSGKNHPLVALRLNNLSHLLMATGRPEEAEPLLRRALDINEAAFGNHHPEITVTLANLAVLLLLSDRPGEAEPLLRRALDIDESRLGKDHPWVAILLSNLAQLLEDDQRPAEAEPLMRRALAALEASFGKNDPQVATALNNLAWLLKSTGRSDEAEPLMRRALTIDETTFGKSHLNVATGLNNLALLLVDTGRLAEAEPLLHRLLEIYITFSAAAGQPHPQMQHAVDNYVTLLEKTGHTPEQAHAKITELVESTLRK